MSKKILLANYGRLGENYHFPVSLAYVASALRRAGLGFAVLDCYIHPYEKQKEALFAELGKGDYHSVGFTAYLGNYSFRYFLELSREIRAAFPGLKIILGGPMASCVPEIILNLGMADMVVIGEGEGAAPDLIRTIESGGDLSHVPGIAYKNGPDAVINPPQARIQDLDALHPLPYDLFPMKFYIDHLKSTGRCFGILGSRGCYSGCTFCYLTYGKKMTFRSVQSITGEMEYLHKTYGISRFNFLDDNFLNVPKFAYDYCQAIEKLGFRPEWRYQARVEKIDEAMIRELVRHGLVGMTMGLESGSDTMLRAIRKGITAAQSERAIALCRQYRIAFSSNFIIGFPEETDETIEETSQFMDRNGIDENVWVNFIVCYPKTPLYDYARRNGIIRDEVDYLSNLGPLGEVPYINISRWSDQELMAKREYLLKNRCGMRAAR